MPPPASPPVPPSTNSRSATPQGSRARAVSTAEGRPSARPAEDAAGEGRPARASRPPESAPPKGSSRPESTPPKGSRPESAPPKGNRPESSPPRGSRPEIAPPKGSRPESTPSRGSNRPEPVLSKGG